MLVEDDPAIALMYQTKLSAAGYQVAHYPDGIGAWQALTTGPRPDLLLLDVVLPKKDGFEILRDLRKDKKLHDLKVVLLTNLAQEIDRKEGAKLGATDYIVKAHITPKELLEAVQKHLAI
jgi:DNA-binding response OmpR family regulator